MKVDIDLKAGFLQNLKREVLAQLTPEERAVIEVSTGEMGNKPDAVKLGWLKMRTKEPWTNQRYTKALARTMEKLSEAVAQAERGAAPAADKDVQDKERNDCAARECAALAVTARFARPCVFLL